MTPCEVAVSEARAKALEARGILESVVDGYQRDTHIPPCLAVPAHGFPGWCYLCLVRRFLEVAALGGDC